MLFHFGNITKNIFLNYPLLLFPIFQDGRRKKKKSETKKADPGGKVKKDNLKAKTQKKEKSCPSQRNWQIFLIGYVFQKGDIQEEVFSS